MSPMPRARTTRPCQVCGIWTCAACGWQRYGASRQNAGKQDCARCGGTEGTFQVIRHSPRTWESHNPASGPKCQAWAAEYNLNLLDDCRHESCQVIGWGHVIKPRKEMKGTA